MVTAPHYTEAQILCGVRQVWRKLTRCKQRIGPQDSILIALYTKGFFSEPDIVLDDAIHEIELYFRFTARPADWRALFGQPVSDEELEFWNDMDEVAASKVTFAALARFIRDRVPYVSIAPAIVAGRPCGPAGVFFGIEQISEDVLGRNVRFPPSAKIRDVLPRRVLDQVWRQLNWMTGASLPSLPTSHRSLSYLGVVLLLGSLLLAFQVSDWRIFLVGISLTACCFGTAAILELVLDPLPKNITTFRDLSILLSKIDCDATRKTT